MIEAKELQRVLDYTPFLLTHCSRDLRYLFVSKAFAEMVGLPPDEIIGKPIVDVIGPEAFARIHPRVDAVLRGQHVEVEDEITFASIGRRRLDVICVPERDERGEVIGWIASMKDVTDLRSSQKTIAAQQKLQEISTQLIGEQRIEALYERIVHAAAVIMHSDCGCVQVYNPSRDRLRLLASTGFDEQVRNHFKWVTAESKTSCGAALRERRRVIVTDVNKSPVIVGGDRDLHLQNGVHAAQTTPLVSREGQLVGMISTHWRHPHHPAEQDLVLLDVLARQAADLIERTQSEEQKRILSREVSHRAKNLLAVVQLIVHMTLSAKDSNPPDLSARLAALAASQELNLQSDWRGVALRELIHSQLEHLGASVGTRIRLDGPQVIIAPSAAQTLGMAIFELATNATKYGALSNSDGIVSIEWSLAEDSDDGFRLSWQERNGPTVEPPRRRGFGSDVIIQMIELALDARVRLEFDSLGVSWHVSAPIEAALVTMRNSFVTTQGEREW